MLALHLFSQHFDLSSPRSGIMDLGEVEFTMVSRSISIWITSGHPYSPDGLVNPGASSFSGSSKTVSDLSASLHACALVSYKRLAGLSASLGACQLVILLLGKIRAAPTFKKINYYSTT